MSPIQGVNLHNFRYTSQGYEERSHSGLVRCLGKAVYSQGYRGFESLPLRQEKGARIFRYGHFSSHEEIDLNPRVRYAKPRTGVYSEHGCNICARRRYNPSLSAKIVYLVKYLLQFKHVSFKRSLGHH